MRCFGRVLTAMVTPFTPDLEVDYDRAAELARRLVDSGSDGIVVAGTTGESPTLTKDEKVNLFRVVAEAVGRDATVIAGTGGNDTRSSVELTRKAEEVGVHGVMAVVPYYNKPPQDGLVAHFKAIAAATNLPVILYNIPGRTGMNMTPETVEKLARVENIVAVKEASGSLDQVTDIRRRTPPSFKIYSGDDSLTLPILAVGGEGIISVASHVVGKRLKEMVEAYVSGQVGRASQINSELFPLFKALFVTTNPIPVKLALRLTGFSVGGLRPPLVEAGEKDAAIVRQALLDLGLVA
ncbi:MAG: 4-hydroxy-tetrahydrodipicolinate synthase [Firmicutes bacterium]|jgi:4-hydroxy-tetrahydrodipicolinate synthase|nr:4-hydroxy-tetrahydrodipicolinate synthase [Bacillota bacterium]MDH7495643.1 4-hydroxy-tetrahydrodipicolinate synthase [Bacillota bacterium]